MSNYHNISEETLIILRHIFNARIDNASDYSAYIAWTSARDIVEYALANNIESLNEFNYLPTKEDIAIEEAEDEEEFDEEEFEEFYDSVFDETGYDPYLGCYDFDC